MGPKILFIGTTCPFGAVSGAGVRTLNLLKLLGRIGDVTAVFATGIEWTPEQLEETREAFNISLFSRYQRAPISSFVEGYRKVFDPKFLNTNGVVVPQDDRLRVADLVSQHDLVWIHTLKLANAFRRYRWPSSVMDVDDFPSRFHRSAAAHAPGLKTRITRYQRSFSWRRHETKCHDRFDMLTVCKEEDRLSFGDPSRIHVVPNGFSAPDGSTSTIERVGNRIGMIGDFNYLPNHDGLKWFIREVWEQISVKIPGLELRLVGKGSGEIAGSFPGARVVGLGYVKDVAEEVASWSCMIVPTRLGGGTHLKVAEGLARKVPIVTTRHGARGYSLVDGKQAFIAEEPSAFSTACITLLQDSEARSRMSEAGWKLFNDRFSWDSILPAVERTVQDCLSRRGPMV